MTCAELIASWAERWRHLRAWGRPLTEVRIEYRRWRPNHHAKFGVAYPAGRAITIYWRLHDIPDTLDTVLHELAHCAAPGQTHHGPKWRETYARAVAEVTGIPLAADLRLHVLGVQALEALRIWWADSGNAFAAEMLLGPQLRRARSQAGRK